ncbi:SGNH/GDSL hydrolase family protein [Lachnospiraceae bacterium 62-26]
MKQVDLTRLKNCMRRAMKGEKLTIGFFGGSITQGCLAAEHERAYSYRVFQWWKDTFPQAEISYVNGGIGGTTSYFGVSRIWQDLLMYQPDVVAVDFSVNDKEGQEAFFQETYEGVIRRILTCQSKPAVIILNHVNYDSGSNLQACHNEVGDWYGIPHVSMKDTLYQRMKEGVYQKEELTPDGLHPSDKGHELAAGEIISFLCKVKGDMGEEDEEKAFPEPMTANAYEHARRLTVREVLPELSGFRIDTDEKTGHLDIFKNGWIGKMPGDRIVFEEEAACIGIQFRQSVERPALRAKLILDGDEEHAWILDGNFDEDWGDCAQLVSILHHGEQKKHRIEIEVLDDALEDATPFYLMSLILS